MPVLSSYGEALARECPLCGATAGRLCRDRGEAIYGVHDERVSAPIETLSTGDPFDGPIDRLKIPSR